MSLALCAAMLLGACADRVTSPQPTQRREMTSVQADSVRLTYICGNRFRIRNPTAGFATFVYDVYGTPERDSVQLPAKDPAAPHIDVYFETRHKGTVRLYLTERLLQTKANGGTSCPATPVPAQAPDSLPEQTLARLRWVSLAPGIRVRQDILIVRFRVGTPQDDRKRAIDAVQGRVIGGIAWGTLEGDYLVLLPTDTTAGNIQGALRILGALPQVESASPDYAMDALWQRPVDGAGWREWKLDGEASTSRPNWALEAVRAPMAWGCSTGSASSRVAVVDMAFYGYDDLTKNVRTSADGAIGGWPEGLNGHGTRVASLLAGYGNDSAGMTGMMWAANLMLYPAATPPDRFTYDGSRVDPSALRINVSVRQAISDGARVIDLSLAKQWRDTAARYLGLVAVVPSDDSAAHVAARDKNANDMRKWIAFARSSQRDPLFVVGAGNQTFDAKWSGYPMPNGESPYRDNLLVVGASTVRGTPWVADDPVSGALRTGSATGTLLDVYAPGEHVWSLDSAGTISQANGTSLAAPIAAGVAGLLFTFDPSLSAAEAKSLIVEGAARRGIGVAQRHQLDAHEPLKLAAARRGAPLCGNRVWSTGGKVVVERERDNPGSDEEVFTFAAAEWSVLNVLHGGRVMRNDFGWSESWEELRWIPELRTWKNYTIDWDLPQPGPDGGTYNSVRGSRNHDGDQLLWTTGTPGDGLDLQLVRWNPITRTYDGSVFATVIPSALTAQRQLVWDSVGIREMPDGGRVVPYHYIRENTTVAVAFAPRGDRAFLAVARNRVEPTGEVFWQEWATDSTGARVYRDADSLAFAYRRDGPTKIIEVAIPSGTMRLVGTVDANVSNIALSESTDELVLTEFDEQGSFLVQPWGGPTWPRSGGVSYRRIEYRPLQRSGAEWVLAAQPARVISMPIGNIRDGQIPGSVAPLRMADRPASARRPSASAARRRPAPSSRSR